MSAAVIISDWPAPGGREEYAITCPADGPRRLLVLPAWFDEANKLRHFTLATMRVLAARGVGCVLPDLPGCNESLVPLESCDLAGWRDAADAAAAHFGCTHVLTFRAGANIAPVLPGFAYAPVAASRALATLLRARAIAAREAGQGTTRETLLDTGQREGLDIGGARLGARMVVQLIRAADPANPLPAIAQTELRGPGLWLRAEPGHDPAQAEALARNVAERL